MSLNKAAPLNSPSERRFNFPFGSGRNTLIIAAVAVLLLLSPVVLPPVWTPVIMSFCLFACMALGWNIVMGYAGQLSLAQTLFVGAGVYTPGLLFFYFRFTPWVGMWLGVVIAAILAAVMGYLCFRYGVKGNYFALVTIAFSQVGLIIVLSLSLGGSQEVFWPITNQAVDFQFNNTTFAYVGLVMLGLMLAFTYFIKGTKMGYYFVALRENEDAAQSLGIHANLYKIIAFVISAAMTSIAATYWGQQMGMAVARDQMGLGTLMMIILCAQLGGLGTVLGPVLGALVVVLLGTGIRYMTLPSGMNMVIYSVVLILAIIFMPRGVIGLFQRTGRRKKPEAEEAAPAAPETIGAATVDLALDCRDIVPGRTVSNGAPLLTVREITRRFGGLTAVNALSLEVKTGEIVGLIGPNGAGKTTAFNMVTGFITSEAGEVVFDGQRIDKKRPDQICRMGMVRTFQIVHPFASMTAAENVMLGSFVHHGNKKVALEKARKVLKILGMEKFADTPAGQLTLAYQRRLELARALATEPRLILLDEAMAGLTPSEINAAVGLIRELRKSGITFLIVEHIMPIIMNLADRVVVMNLGARMAVGTPTEICRNQQVIDAYLGEEIALA
jgi:branched-chain amino acid transport system permease protein